MKIYCHWCRTQAIAKSGEHVTCRNCGHRADTIRLLCDCPRCSSSEAKAIDEVIEDRPELVRGFYRWKKARISSSGIRRI